jgi:dihydrofolate synthase/folylpolyglutamate synthase
MIDPDYSLITTVALDHQAWLGQTINEIAVEKAGIMRTGAPAFYGDQPVPAAIEARALELGTRLRCFARDFDFEAGDDTWSWRGESEVLSRLPNPDLADGAQLRNVSLVLAAVEAHDRTLLDRSLVGAALGARRPDGRFQVIRREHEWVLDVAHNPQAAAVLAERLRGLADPGETTVVVGMLADKQIESVVAELAVGVDRWIVCSVDDPRAVAAEDLAARITKAGGENVVTSGEPDAACALATRLTGSGGRIVVCGSFRAVGPALRWLNLY